MTTRSLAIADHIETLLSGVSGVTIHRDIVRAIDRAEQLALVVEHGDEPAPQVEFIGTTERAVEINVSVVAKGSAPYSRADAPLLAAHNLIMADRSLGGLALDINEGPATRQRDALEREVGVITKTYTVAYRTASDSLE